MTPTEVVRNYLAEHHRIVGPLRKWREGREDFAVKPYFGIAWDIKKGSGAIITIKIMSEVDKNYDQFVFKLGIIDLHEPDSLQRILKIVS
jgi:hypothetical protein